MSFALFKKNMTSYMENQGVIETYQDFGSKLTTEYDMAIRRGYQIVNTVSIEKPNLELMESLINIAATIALQKQKGLHHIINDIGKGIIGYWTGATLNKFPVPIIPAAGSMLNIATTSAYVTNPGKFPEMGEQYPTTDVGIFLDALILGMIVHLTTISGMYLTISIYPGVPALIAPGIVLWTGYTVPPAPKTVVVPQIDNPTPNIPDSEFILSNEQIEAKKIEKIEADNIANDRTLPIQGRTSAREYSKLMVNEIVTKTITAIPVVIPPAELEEISESLEPDRLCEIGKKIVENASRDLGIIEFGSPPGKNYGGIHGGIQRDERGRIDDMFDIVGLDNQAKVRNTGTGYYWCAAAISAWWQEAGAPIPSGGASCDNWMKWGKQNGYWSSEPKIGAAVLYGSTTDAHHIGIVASILPNGKIITIEGNTSGAGFDRNGVGVFQKIPRKFLGFVIPPECV